MSATLFGRRHSQQSSGTMPSEGPGGLTATTAGDADGALAADLAAAVSPGTTAGGNGATATTATTATSGGGALGASASASAPLGSASASARLSKVGSRRLCTEAILRVLQQDIHRCRRRSAELSAASDLVVGAPLGKGGYGSVYKGAWHHTPAAVKVRVQPSFVCVGCCCLCWLCRLECAWRPFGDSVSSSHQRKHHLETNNGRS